MGYTIKQVSNRTQLSPHALRFYEKEGLLPHVNRTKSGIRSYSDDDLEWLGLINCLKNTGMTIVQIKAFVDLSMAGPSTLKQRCDMLIEHKNNVEAKILEMYNYLNKVSHKISYFSKLYESYSTQTKKITLKKSDSGIINKQTGI